MNWLSDLVLAQSSSALSTGPAAPLWGLLAVVLLLTAIPMGPAEPTAAAAGLMAGAASVPLWVVVLVVAAGMFAGDLLAFSAGGPITRRLHRRPAAAARLRRWQERLDAHPAWRDVAVIGLRFIPGARTPSALAARGTSIGTARFCVLTGVGAVLWAAAWTATGSMAAELPAPVATAVVIAVVSIAALLIGRHLPSRAPLGLKHAGPTAVRATGAADQ